MTKKILLGAALLAATTSTAFAATETFQATITGFSEPSISESSPLNFGQIALFASASCVMDSAGVVTGDCDAADSNIQIGEITITGLAPSSAMNITVSGSSGSNVSFVSSSSATDGTTTVNFGDSTATGFTTDSSATDIALNVFGTMTVDSALTSGQAYTADYTVEVVFQ
ncbi:hypothetical protein AADZ84_12015 [Colwelliaceae bacterium MEBiC 14330]